MKNGIDLKDLKGMGKRGAGKTKSDNKKKRTYYDRLNDAVETGFSFKEDEIHVDLEKEECFIKFKNTVLINHNDLLRIKFNVAYKYIKLWKERVVNVVKKLDDSQMKIFLNNPVKIEILIETKNAMTLDYDASIGSSKFIIDGLVKSKILEDDTKEHIPLILTSQKKSKVNISSIYIIIKPIKEYELRKYFSDSFNKLIDM